jgi:hypothetical protein
VKKQFIYGVAAIAALALAAADCSNLIQLTNGDG